MCGQLILNCDRWQNRDLFDVDLLYLFCDGIYLRLRPEDPKAVAVLCAYGIKSDGRKVLLHLAVGEKESAVCWKSFFEHLKRRGLNEPLLVGIDRFFTGFRGERLKAGKPSVGLLAPVPPSRESPSGFTGALASGHRLP